MTETPTAAKTIFLSCIDFRLLKADAEFVAQHGGAFHPCLAGGGAAVLDPAFRPVALKQFQLAFTLSSATEVYLESHTDCGAYRLNGVTFSSPAEEVSRLYEDLDEAGGYVRTALQEAGAAPEAIVIHTRVVSPDGQLQERV